MERSKNLSVTLESTRVIKSSGSENRRLRQRLQNEHSALNLVGSRLPDRVPEVFSFSLDGSAPGIVMERLKTTKGVSFGSIAQLIEDLQTLPIDARMPVYGPSDYRLNAEAKLRFLRRQGPIIGLSRGEVNSIRGVYSKLLHHLEPFLTVFVHGDIQSRHLALKSDRLAILDFDQAHFGSELEDWAFLSIRHPRFSDRIDIYLREKFGDNPEQSASLKPAFLLLQIDKLLHGYFSRTYQWRGRPFDVGAKLYGRNRIRALLKKAERLSSTQN